MMSRTAQSGSEDVFDEASLTVRLLESALKGGTSKLMEYMAKKSASPHCVAIIRQRLTKKMVVPERLD